MLEQHTTIEQSYNLETAIKFIKVVIKDLKFEPEKPGQLYDLLTLLDGYGDIRYANLSNSDSDCIICNVPEDKVIYLKNRLKDLLLTTNIGSNPVVDGDLIDAEEIYRQPENIDTMAFIYDVVSEQKNGDNITLTLNIPDTTGSLSELLLRFKQAKINLESLNVQVKADGKDGIAVVSFKDTDITEVIKADLTEPKTVKFDELTEQLKVNLTEEEFINLKAVALYQSKQNKPIPPNVSEDTIKKLGTSTINSIIHAIRNIYISKLEKPALPENIL